MLVVVEVATRRWKEHAKSIQKRCEIHCGLLADRASSK